MIYLWFKIYNLSIDHNLQMCWIGVLTIIIIIILTFWMDQNPSNFAKLYGYCYGPRTWKCRVIGY